MSSKSKLAMIEESEVDERKPVTIHPKLSSHEEYLWLREHRPNLKLRKHLTRLWENEVHDLFKEAHSKRGEAS